MSTDKMKDRERAFEAVYFARVDAAGVKQGGDVRLTTDPEPGRNPSLAWTGDEYGVAWRQNTVGRIAFARVSAAGVKLGGDVVVSQDDAVDPDLAWTGEEYDLVWEDNRDNARHRHRRRAAANRATRTMMHAASSTSSGAASTAPCAR